MQEESETEYSSLDLPEQIDETNDDTYDDTGYENGLRITTVATSRGDL